jgi:hypothetical protein
VTAFVVFLATAAYDIAWARYTSAVSQRRAVRAAWWSATIYAFGAFATIQYTRDPWLIIPALLGAFLGTWIGVVRR